MLVRAFSLVALAACTSSSRPPNAQLQARTDALFDNDAHTVHVGIEIDDGTAASTGYPNYFEIAPDEHVRIGFRDQTLDLMYGTSSADGYVYRGTLPFTGEVNAGEEIRVEIDRDDDADVTIMAPAPPPFTLMGPTTWMRSEALTITWTPTSSERMAWTALNGDGPIPIDMGTITFPIGIVASPSSPYKSSVGLRFSRTGQTTPDSPLSESQFSVTQTSNIFVEDQTP